jgi:transcriptional regulator with XRE-family HTH domain
MTQEALALASEVDQTTISSLETGRHTNPTRETQERLAKALGIAPSRLRFPEPDADSVTATSDRSGHEDVKAS